MISNVITTISGTFIINYVGIKEWYIDTGTNIYRLLPLYIGSNNLAFEYITNHLNRLEDNTNIKLFGYLDSQNNFKVLSI